MMVRAWLGGSWAKDAPWSLVKQTTSHRPAPGADAKGRSAGGPGVSAPVVSAAASENAGKRFSKTATS